MTIAITDGRRIQNKMLYGEKTAACTFAYQERIERDDLT
jgi:hypothetical protein